MPAVFTQPDALPVRVEEEKGNQDDDESKVEHVDYDASMTKDYGNEEDQEITVDQQANIEPISEIVPARNELGKGMISRSAFFDELSSEGDEPFPPNDHH